MGEIFIGTSGFSYPHWGKGIFYPKDLPQKDWFSYYVKHFNSVELNVSFYRLPKKEVFAGWRKKAGKDFVFAVKGSRYISHVKKLKDCQEPVERFFESASGLNIELGIMNKEKNIRNSRFEIRDSQNVVLWQLPPRFKANPERLEKFLSHLRGVPRAQHHPGGDWRYAFEFRSSTWLTVKIFQQLRRYNAAVVFQDFPEWPITEELTSDFAYLRFHGKTNLYTSCYTERQ